MSRSRWPARTAIIAALAGLAGASLIPFIEDVAQARGLAAPLTALSSDVGPFDCLQGRTGACLLDGQPSTFFPGQLDQGIEVSCQGEVAVIYGRLVRTSVPNEGVPFSCVPGQPATIGISTDGDAYTIADLQVQPLDSATDVANWQVTVRSRRSILEMTPILNRVLRAIPIAAQ